MVDFHQMPSRHAAFIYSLQAITQLDERLSGVAIAGSLATGTADSASDVDVQVIVREADLENLLSSRDEFVAQFGDVLAAFTGEHIGEPRLTITLYADLLHVDFKFMTLDTFRDDRVENPKVLWERNGQLSQIIAAYPKDYPEVDVQWIEDRFWVWIHYIAAKIQRGEALEAAASFSWLTQSALAPMVRINQGLRNRSTRLLERDVPIDSPQLWRIFPKDRHRQELKRCLLESVKIYRECRVRYQGSLIERSSAEMTVVQYVEEL